METRGSREIANRTLFGRFKCEQKRGFIRLRVSELSTPFTSAQSLLRRLKSKYPTLNACIVVASQYGQADPIPDALKLFEHIPSAFVDSVGRKEALILFDIYQELGRRNRDLNAPFLRALSEQCRQRLDVILATAEIVESTQLQLRFGQLDYGLIRQLQIDPLVDQVLTPRSGASIKIVLGTLASLRRREVVSFDVPNECSTY